MTGSKLNHTPLSDLELYELLVAAYPEKFDADSEDDLWDDVMEYADELVTDIDVHGLMDLLGRVVMLTHPVKSAISGHIMHALGTVEIVAGWPAQIHMTACVTRKVPVKKEVANA